MNSVRAGGGEMISRTSASFSCPLLFIIPLPHSLEILFLVDIRVRFIPYH